jgi:hypothetical protein
MKNKHHKNKAIKFLSVNDEAFFKSFLWLKSDYFRRKNGDLLQPKLP